MTTTIRVTKKNLPFLLVVTILLAALISCSCPSTPSISSLSPNSATVGGAGFILTVNGGSFSGNAVVVWNGTAQTTSFVNDKQLTASIPGSDIAQPDTAVVYVYNPVSSSSSVTTGPVQATNNTGCGASGSNSMSFTITP